MRLIGHGRATRGNFSCTLILAATALLAAGCSSSVDRFADYPDINTNSVNTNQKSASVDRVQTTPLTGDRVAAARPAWQNAPSPTGPGYTPPQHTSQPSYQPQRQAAANPGYGASRDGYVVVRPGQTMYSLARSNGLTVSQLARANSIGAPYTLTVGQRLVIPGVSNPISPQPTVMSTNAPASHAPSVARQQQGDVHVVRPGETLYSLGRAYNVHPHSIAQANGLSNNHSLRIGERITIPGSDSYRSPIARSAPAPAPRQDYASNEQPAQPQYQPVPTYKDDTRLEQSTEIQQKPDIGGGFRWPVRGRVISTFGVKPDNKKNEGINIAVPEGTAVRAAEAGVVAYAGNELKGYGNLVLIRHKNGWVTAYAHNKELTVRRGDAVRRGDIIARAGQTGSVNSPQLHFEVRKGAEAVDPMKYLSSRTAAY